jgi:epoxide hydrolase-like predicted phosphatase
VHPDIDAVLFDFAGVLTHSPKALMAERAAAAGVSVHEMLASMFGPLDDDTDHPWHRVERGEITLDEYATAMQPRFEAAGHAHLPLPPRPDRMQAALTPCPEMIAVAAEARAAGYRTAIVSNNLREFDWRDLVGADSLVEVVVDSSWVGMRKPSAAIFHHALALLGGVEPARALFLDDFEWNVAGADRAGLQTMHVVDPVASARELRARLRLATTGSQPAHHRIW